MAVHFKGVGDQENRRRKTGSRSASPNFKMHLAGVRSDHQGVTREPQFQSRRKVLAHVPQVARSLQWEGRLKTDAPPACSVAAQTENTAETPLTPFGPRPEGKPESPTPVPAAPGEENTHSKTHSPLAGKAQPALHAVHHVLRRKAGLKPSRPRSRHQNSEYQRQFMWKAPVDNSPLLTAEQAFCSSGVGLPLHKPNPLVFQSEYQRSFKASPPPRAPRLRRDVERNEVPVFHRETPKKHSKAKRKKRKEHFVYRNCISPKEDMTHGQQDVESPVAKQALNSGYRNAKSEYDSCFRSPLQYCYRDGVWVKASAAGDEVRELREKAAFYRRRARGTHFSRHHLNQILSEQNRLWEASTSSSNGSSGPTGGSGSPIIEALDLAREGSGTGSASSVASVCHTSMPGRGSPVQEAGPPNDPCLPVQRRLAWEEREGLQEKPRRKEEHPEGEEEKEEHRKAGEGEAENQQLEGSEARGRLPTPKMKTMPASQRTHHDRTTPTTGGAILVSPPKAAASRGGLCSEPPLGKSHSPYKHLHQASPDPAATQVNGEQPMTRSPPAAGLTTADPLPLRDEEWSVEHVASDPPEARLGGKAKTRVAAFVSLPPRASRIQGALRDPEFQHNGNLGVHRPELFIYAPSDPSLSDDDRMSQISSRSAASCSMASEVLGRAQRRREEFWGKS
ncbi:nuclear protein MDM1 isoform X2 [Denticeps clupeoides]|uniref:Nuclear protein MDM1 n=1 Tax=Denticeps clupeoides TaxID=299321 RepID=A0AAY4ELF1_9TELE|nr:nuclear protein MDM1 isoform X2 [Denticeps clupeoides]